MKAVQGGEGEVAAPRAHAGVVEGLLETLNERGPGECEHQHGGGNRRAQEPELVRARAKDVAAGDDEHDDRDHQEGHHPAAGEARHDGGCDDGQRGIEEQPQEPARGVRDEGDGQRHHDHLEAREEVGVAEDVEFPALALQIAQDPPGPQHGRPRRHHPEDGAQLAGVPHHGGNGSHVRDRDCQRGQGIDRRTRRQAPGQTCRGHRDVAKNQPEGELVGTDVHATTKELRRHGDGRQRAAQPLDGDAADGEGARVDADKEQQHDQHRSEDGGRQHDQREHRGRAEHQVVGREQAGCDGGQHGAGDHHHAAGVRCLGSNHPADHAGPPTLPTSNPGWPS